MASTSVEDEDEHTVQFHEMGVDDRILEAISKLGWSQPTPIQEKAIPLALQGKDILARARTGSGKTAAYAIAVIQKLLHIKQTAAQQATRAIILTPSKELCNQAFRNILELTVGCSRDIRCTDISPQVPLASQRSVLIEKPDILVATPSRLLAHVRAGNVDVKESLEMLVVDEADLVFSFGYEGDIKELLDNFPKIYQAFMMSATLDDDVKSLKKMVLHNAVVLRLEESQLPEASQLNQYHIKCEEKDKFALVAALLKLNLVRGKTMFFVNSVNKCYQLKLFLEQFGIRACILNSELPVNSRCHIVNQFNDGLYDYIIASDETTTEGLPAPVESRQKQKSKRFRKQDKEYGVSRGIDFYNVSNVLNFDFPKTSDSYIHRVGRTARADNQGTALSFVSIKDAEKLKKVEEALSGDNSDDAENVFKPYNFKMEEIEGFRYRAKDALQAVTRTAIQEARLKDVRQEIFNSDKLRSYFDDNPQDLQALRHDKPLHTVKGSKELKHVPQYIVPQSLRSQSGGSRRRNRDGHSGQHKQSRPAYQTEKKFMKRKADPLKSFEFAGLADKKKKKRQK
ncbi:probable ATP-dependent RNA helicase DDX56 [Aplysia californica]|uniref:RNA helicase n=1 Tax=Aplysia californica TaxID=6500 RepID=A0ABM0JAD8_APLCA|nr:probable ATP-dependent RNA helicase DDX56 [Aplysia californica]